MNPESPIDVVRKRLSDLVMELRAANAEELAARVTQYQESFTEVTGVRRSVSELSRLLEQLRAGIPGMPDSARVMIAANHLEDACRAALKGGVIAPAAPTLVAQAKRKTLLILTTVVVGILAVLVPTVIVALGFGVDDLEPLPPLGPVVVPRGSTTRMRAMAPSSPMMDGVKIAPVYKLDQACESSVDQDVLSCNQASKAQRLLDGNETLELRKQGKAHGLLVAFADPEMSSDRARVDVYIGADKFTPVGRYVVPLRAAYRGYGFDPDCSSLQRRLRICPRLRGERLVDDLLPAQQILVDVVAMSEPAPVQLQDAGASESPTEASLEAKLVELEELLEEAQAALLRRSHGDAAALLGRARERLLRLERTSLEQPAAAPSADALEMLRLMLSARADTLEHFEESVFDTWYRRAHPNDTAERRAVDFAELAKRFRADEDYVVAIVATRAELTAQREQQAASAAEEKKTRKEQVLLKRCGPLPTDSWRLIADFLRDHHRVAATSYKVLECLSPRLEGDACWQVECDYERITQRPDGTKYGARLRATFAIKRGRAVRLTNPAR